MRTKFARLSVLAALAVPLGMMGISVASASADTTTCTGNSGTIKLSPGLSGTAHVQNISIKGTLSGCSGEESAVTGGKYVAHLKTAEGVTCSALTGAGAAEVETNIVIKWSPTGGGNSMGTFSMPLTEVPGVSLGGTLASGPFSGDSIAGTVSQTFTGGATCGVAEGKKKAKKGNKGAFTGSAVTIS
ncbi:MAG TPA: hypothetical protein VES97_01590 [Solirubrobacteraceae bacterium]|nr:hypothetical protein [Solirubrobacteraceae bacterium]